jgi:hypothetical protein
MSAELFEVWKRENPGKYASRLRQAGGDEALLKSYFIKGAADERARIKAIHDLLPGAESAEEKALIERAKWDPQGKAENVAVQMLRMRNEHVTNITGVLDARRMADPRRRP